MAYLIDSLTNLLTGLGGLSDKAAAARFITPLIDDNEIMNAYRGSAIAKKIVNIPALDACREWREWSGDPSHVAAIEKSEANLILQKKVKQAKISARLFGGSAIMIGTGDNDPMQPLDPERITRGGLKFLTVLSKNSIQAGELEDDTYAEGYGEPKYFNLSGGKNPYMRIHPSRLAIFQGEELPDKQFWGGSVFGFSDSILLSRMTNIRNLESTAQNIAALIHDAKTDVIKIPKMMENLRNKVYEKNLMARLTLANRTKGNLSILLMDADEEYEQKTFSFSNLHNIIDRAMQLVAGDADIPATRLFGASPAGLNATGESDLRNYYDIVKTDQTLEIGPSISILDECMIRSTLGMRPDDLTYSWKPLWQASVKERAESGKVFTEIFNILSQSEQFDPDLLANALIDVLSGSDILPGLTAEVEIDRSGEE